MDNDFLKCVISLNQLGKIRASLHFNDNNHKQFQKGQSGFDKLYKIRPVIYTLRQKFLTVSMEERLSLLTSI
jgi:hypothetical protein